jgi:peroxiredoxin
LLEGNDSSNERIDEAVTDIEDPRPPISIQDIDGSFVPRRIPGAAHVELDGDVVLGVRTGSSLQTFCLNRMGGVIWECFDGSASLDELIDDLSDVFAADREVVAQDVIQLTQQLGLHGLLDGVALVIPDWEPPAGLPIGTDLPPAELTELDGRPVSLAEFRGRQALLINWSPRCGFCVSMAPELSELVHDLRTQGVEPILLAIGTSEENRQLVADHDLQCTVLLQTGNVAAFHGIGTPSAYLVDESGRVASPLAVGSDQVPALARDAAGRGNRDAPQLKSDGSA